MEKYYLNHATAACIEKQLFEEQCAYVADGPPEERQKRSQRWKFNLKWSAKKGAYKCPATEARAEQLRKGWKDSDGMRHEAISADPLPEELRARVRCMHTAVVTMLSKHLADVIKTGEVPVPVRISRATQSCVVAVAGQ